MRKVLGIVFLALTVHLGTAVAQTWTPEQQEIWRLEDQQWKMSAAKDPSWIDTMVHANLSYWDAGEAMPQNKASLTRWSRYDYANNTVLEQELFPISLVITDNAAVAHYRYRRAVENSRKERRIVTGRYTDVFIKDGSRWLFLTWSGGDDSAE
jgi:hypothetical protein